MSCCRAGSLDRALSPRGAATCGGLNSAMRRDGVEGMKPIRPAPNAARNISTAAARGRRSALLKPTASTGSGPVGLMARGCGTTLPGRELTSRPGSFSVRPQPMSALPPIADITLHRSACPLCAKSRHRVRTSADLSENRVELPGRTDLCKNWNKN